MTRILVTGSRDWADADVVRMALAETYVGKFYSARVDELPTLVHGACPTGADSIADSYAHGLGWHVEAHPADWDRHGKAAGPIRNQEMVDAGADVCLAFLMPHSRGTVDCVNRAAAAGIPVERWHGHVGARA